MARLLNHLVIITPGFPRDESDTTCIPFQQHFLLELKDAYPETKITVISLQYPYHTRPYTWNGIPVIPFEGKNKGGLKRLLIRRRVLQRLSKLHDHTPIDGLLSFWYGEGAACAELFANRHSVLHFCWLWGQDARSFNKYPARINMPSNRIISLSDFLQSEFEKNHSVRPLTVIPPGVATPGVEHQEKKIDILATGSLIPLKRYDQLIRLIADIKAKFPSIRCTLIGDGPEHKNLLKLTAELKLQSNISFTGELPHEQVLDHMRAAKLFIHTSTYEGFGMVCLEAIAAGAVVCSYTKPMQFDLPNWHVIKGEQEMKKIVISLLKDYKAPGRQVPLPISKTVHRVAQLFSSKLR
jgi:glycosyltransferase involved in cell wall biosynthesis